MLICTSEEAIETSVARCDVAARDLLLPYGDVVMALSIVLRIKRTLDGTEIDDLRPNTAPRRWRKRELSAHSFEAKCHHDDDPITATSCTRSVQ